MAVTGLTTDACFSLFADVVGRSSFADAAG
jgi:hypothetical protein